MSAALTSIWRCRRGSKLRPGTVLYYRGVRAVSGAKELAECAGGAASDKQVVRLPAEIDIANIRLVEDLLLAALRHGTAVVVADMTGTSFCDCAGVNALLEIARYARQNGAELKIAARSRPVLRTFELTGLAAIVAVYPSAAAALAGARRTGGAAQSGQIGLIRISHRRRRAGPD